MRSKEIQNDTKITSIWFHEPRELGARHTIGPVEGLFLKKKRYAGIESFSPIQRANILFFFKPYNTNVSDVPRSLQS